MIEIITGKRELMPKDIMLASMRTLYGLAEEYQAMMLYAIRTPPENEAHKIKLDGTVAFCEGKMREYLLLSAQVARDAAPFVHARFAALAVTTDRNTGEDLFDLLLREIDQGPRFKLIEGGRHNDVQKDDDEEGAA